MGPADWSIVVGWLTYIVALFFAAFYYFKYKKISLVVYIFSIATYVFSVFYTWDVFELSKNGVLALLVLSVIVMIFLGNYFSKVDYKPDKMHTSLKEKKNEK